MKNIKLKDIIKDYILSNQLYNKYRFESVNEAKLNTGNIYELPNGHIVKITSGQNDSSYIYYTAFDPESGKTYKEDQPYDKMIKNVSKWKVVRESVNEVGKGSNWAEKYVNDTNLYKKLNWYMKMGKGVEKKIKGKEFVIMSDGSALIWNTKTSDWELYKPKRIDKKTGKPIYESVNEVGMKSKAKSVDDYVVKDGDYKGSHTAPQPEGKNSLDGFSEIFPDDASDPNFARYYGMGGEYAKADAETIAVMKAVQGNPDAEVVIYRAVPKGTKDINAGDWVSTSKDYTRQHGERYIDGDYDIIEKKVRAGDLNTDGDLHEWGYNPKKVDDGVEYTGTVSDEAEGRDDDVVKLDNVLTSKEKSEFGAKNSFPFKGRVEDLESQIGNKYYIETTDDEDTYNVMDSKTKKFVGNFHYDGKTVTLLDMPNGIMESVVNEAKDMTFNNYLDILDRRYIDIAKAVNGGSEEMMFEAKLSKIYNAAKKGSYPVTLVVTENGKVIKQELVGTPQIVPAAFNQLKKEYPKATVHVESKTGERLFSESINKKYNKSRRIMKNIKLKDIIIEGKKFHRLPSKLNAMSSLKNSVDLLASNHESGQDYKPEIMKTIEELIKDIKKSAKAFKSADEVGGTIYESTELSETSMKIV